MHSPTERELYDEIGRLRKALAEIQKTINVVDKGKESEALWDVYFVVDWTLKRTPVWPRRTAVYEIAIPSKITLEEDATHYYPIQTLTVEKWSDFTLRANGVIVTEEFWEDCRDMAIQAFLEGEV